MFHTSNYYGRRLLLSLVLGLSSSIAFAAEDCGEQPAVPEVVDGSSVTMDELVANSEAVKAYIADADNYLTCYEKFAETDEYKELTADEQKVKLDAYKETLNARNAIGDEFNAQVKAFKEANPS